MGWPGGKEYPVSDDEWGVPPSKRPDPKAASIVPQLAHEGEAVSRKDRLRRQTRRPGRKDGISDGEGAGEMSAASVRKHGSRDAIVTEDSQPLFKARRNGKRQRRRKGKNRKQIPDCHNADQKVALVESREEGGTPRDGERNPARRPHNEGGPKRTWRHNRSPNNSSPLYAALDLGTNNCRLLIATPQRPGRFRVVDAFSRIVRLGEGLGRSGALGAAAMDRSIEALKACAGKLDQRNIRSLRLIATEACRRAENGPEFLERVEHETGMKLEIVDRETEARLAVAGCSSLIDRESKGVVLFDIGGGSSELALLDLRKRKRNDFGPSMISWTSLPVGVVTLSERHGGGKQVTREVFEAMVAEVEEMLEGYEGRDALAAAAAEGDVHLLGTSGTVTTLAGIHLKLPKYDRRQVDGVWMGSRQIGIIVDQLVDMSFEERMQNPCIGRDRADLVLAGCAILVAIQRLWPYPRLRVADRGLREGLLMEMMNADNVWKNFHRQQTSSQSRQDKRR